MSDDDFSDFLFGNLMGRFGSSVRYIFMVISFKVSVALNANIRTKAVIINHQINERVCARGYSLNEMIFKASQVFFRC